MQLLSMAGDTRYHSLPNKILICIGWSKEIANKKLHVFFYLRNSSRLQQLIKYLTTLKYFSMEIPIDIKVDNEFYMYTSVPRR